MKRSYTWQMVLIIMIVALAILGLYSRPIRRGIDLRGGGELLFRIDTTDIDREQHPQLAEETVNRVWFPVPVAAWCGWNFWSVTTGVILIAIAYLIALLDGSTMRHRTPERFILGSCEPDQVPTAAARRLV